MITRTGRELVYGMEKEAFLGPVGGWIGTQLGRAGRWVGNKAIGVGRMMEGAGNVVTHQPMVNMGKNLADWGNRASKHGYWRNVWNNAPGMAWNQIKQHPGLVAAGGLGIAGGLYLGNRAYNAQLPPPQYLNQAPGMYPQNLG